MFIKREKIAYIGAYGMKDYPTYMKKWYKIRYNEDIKTKWTNRWLANKLLW